MQATEMQFLPTYARKGNHWVMKLKRLEIEVDDFILAVFLDSKFVLVIFPFIL